MAFRSHVLVCAGTGCVSCGSFELGAAIEGEIAKRGLAGEVQVVRTGCQGFCAEGPVLIVQPDEVFYCGLKKSDVPTLVEEHLLKGRPGQEADVHAAGGAGADPDAEPDPVLREAEAGRPAQPRPDRPRADRGLHRPGRLPGAGEGARRDDPRADHPGDQAVGAARPRRRRVPGGHEMGDVPAGGDSPRRRARRRLQRRRGRPRRVHGSEHHRERPAFGDRGHGHRREGDRRDAGLRLHPARVPHRPRAARQGAGTGARVRAARPGHPRHEVRLRHFGGPGRRRLRVRRVDGADGVARGQGRRAARQVHPHRGVRLQEPADQPEQRRDLGQRAAHHQPRRGLVHGDGHGRRQREPLERQLGHESVLAGRQGQQHRA